jgi:hypothetical protein
MTTPETREPKRPGKYRITQDRWCWCGVAAAYVVERKRDGEIMEPVCSLGHGQRSIEWLEDGVVREPE